MRIWMIYLVVFICAGTEALWGQKAGGPLRLHLVRQPLAVVLDSIERQTGRTFSYESSLLNGLPPVSLTTAGEELPVCLNRLLAPLSLSYTFAGRYIILKRKPRLYTVSGFIRDSASSESLINATLQEVLSGEGTMTNNYGFYSLTLPPGRIRLRTSYVGYKASECSFDLQKDTVLDFAVAVSALLKEVLVEGRAPSSELLSSRTGSVEFSSRTIREVPSLFGEPDLFRTLQHIPGVSPGTEGLTGLLVRGGNADENLFLIDGNPVYHVNHVGGLFSTFNPDAVKNVEFYKGNFPARYGGRLSSVVDVRMKDGDMQTYHGGISVGLLSATAYLEGPLIKQKTSFYLAFRRTWMDLITAPTVAIMNKIHKERDKAGYSFYDLNGKINHIFSDRSRLSLNVYAGQDRVRWGGSTDSVSFSDLKWRWGNFVGSVNWNYVFSPKLFMNVTASYSRFQARMWEIKEKYDGGGWTALSSGKTTVRGSYIQDIGNRIDFDYLPLPNHRIRFGSDYLYHQYRPEQHWTTKTFADASGGSPVERQEIYANQWLDAHEGAFYAEDDWRLSDRWKMNAGARLAVYHVQERTYFSLQPRVSLRYWIRPDWSAKLSYSKMDQYVHQLSNAYLNLPSDIWVPVTEKIRPMVSHQVCGGLYYEFRKTLDFTLEGYYKQMNNLIEYRDGASLFPKYVHWDEKIAMGEGRAYGLEAMVRKPAGRVTGWIGYTLAWADRYFQDGTVNAGMRFPSKYDNRHKLNIAVVYHISPKVELSAAWTYLSGNRVTVALDSYSIFSPGEFPSPYPGGGTDWTYEPIFRRNAVKLGDYHRLDLGLNIYRRTKKGHMGIWNVSFYNAYCRMNPFHIESLERNSDGSWRAVQKGYVPIIPSFSYTYKF